jgi:hypothetical protein
MTGKYPDVRRGCHELLSEHRGVLVKSLLLVLPLEGPPTLSCTVLMA